MEGEFVEDLEFKDFYRRNADKLCPFMDTLRRLDLMINYQRHVVEKLVEEKPYTFYSVKMIRVWA